LREVAMGSKPTENSVEKMMLAVMEEAKANKKLPQLLAPTMTKLREKDPNAADVALRTIIEAMAASMPEGERQKFLEELLAFGRPN
jgi:hypothetical protein